jgi:hypothetical protein
MERKFDQESEGPQWVQGKAPQPSLDLVNFDLRNHSQCTTSTSLMKNCSMVKKILIILSEKRFYYIFLFLKVNQCKFKQKETILKLGNPLKKKDVTWFCIFSCQRQMYKFGRNKLDHSEKKYGLPL